MTTKSPVITIKSIEQKTKLRSVIVRILRLWMAKNKFGKQSIEMILIDDEGSKIQASVPTSLVATMKKMFSEGQIKKISNFGVEENNPNPQKAKINHAWKMTLSLATKVSEVEIPTQISENGFLFTPFNDLDNYPEEFMLDVIGEVILPLRDFEFVAAANARKMDVTLVDNEGLQSTCILWESYGDELKSFVDNRGDNVDDPIILILQFVRLSKWKGTRVSTMKHASKIHINPAVREQMDFMSKRSDRSSSKSLTLTTITNDTNIISNEWFKIEDIRTIADLLNCKVVGDYTMLSTIFDVDSVGRWYYDGCSNAKCTKGFDKVAGKCQKCGTIYGNNVPTPRFKIKINVMDVNEVVTHFVLFDSPASYLLKKSAVEVLTEVSEPDQLPQSFGELIGRQCLFKVAIDERTKDTADENRIFTVKKLTEDVNIINQFISLTNSDEVASKLNLDDENVSILNDNVGDNPLESMGENTSTSIYNDITPKKRPLNIISNDEEVQLSVTKGFKQVKQEKLDK